MANLAGARTLLDDQLNYLNTFRSLVEQQMQFAARPANITQEGKILIKSELQRLYPDYIPGSHTTKHA